MDVDRQIKGGGRHWAHGRETQGDGQRAKWIEGHRSFNEKSTRDRKCMAEGTTAGKRESISMYGQFLFGINPVYDSS